MKGLLRSLADGINRLPEALPDEPMLVYGTGSRGKAVEAFLVDRGDDVPDFTEAATSDRDSWRQWRIRTRFDWTRSNAPADPAKIDEIVNNAADAGFNVILFQVRGAADAYYAPGLEPWAQRVTGGSYGQAPVPFWDPLAYFVQRAHARGLQLHAYINVYPVWDNCTNSPPMAAPPFSARSSSNLVCGSA